MRSHSWHPVPFLLHGGPPRSAAASAGRLTKFGA